MGTLTRRWLGVVIGKRARNVKAADAMDYNTSDMAHQIPRCIEWASALHTLEPGDILASGTNHRGLHAFQNGDRIELEIDGLGRLAFTVSDGLKRTWSRERRLWLQ